MSNADARLSRTLSQGGKPSAVGETRRTENRTRALLLAAVLFAGDFVSGVMAVATAAVIVATAFGAVGLVGRMNAQAGLLLVLLLGINCSLGLYRSNSRNPLERFRLRVTATLLFV